MLPRMNELELTIRQGILDSGPITFAEFMDAALYSPMGGYYTRLGSTAGSMPSGGPVDYFTSPMAHPAFGALIAVQLRDMWRRMARSGTFTVVEMGAGDGLLARDVTVYAARLDPAFADALEYAGCGSGPSAELVLHSSWYRSGPIDGDWLPVVQRAP